MLLGADENILRSEYAVLLEGQGTGVLPRSTGVLYLTNHRCVYETTPSRGVVKNLTRGRETVTILDAPLAQVHNVSVIRPRLGRVRLHLEVHRARLTFDLLDPLMAAGELPSIHYTAASSSLAASRAAPVSVCSPSRCSSRSTPSTRASRRT
jgi:hypothetical protein